MIVEIDEELEPLPDDEHVPDTVQQPPAANDTIQPEALAHLAIVPDASADEELVTKEAAQPVTSRLPLSFLAGMLGVIAVAAVAATGWALRRRNHTG